MPRFEGIKDGKSKQPVRLSRTGRSNRSGARRKRGRHTCILASSTSRSAYRHRSCPRIRLDNQPPTTLTSLSLFFRKPTEFCFCLSSIDIEGSGVDFCIENQLPRLCLLGRRRRRQPFISLAFSPLPSVLSPVLYTRFSLLLTLSLVRYFAQTLSTCLYHYPAFGYRRSLSRVPTREFNTSLQRELNTPTSVHRVIYAKDEDATTSTHMPDGINCCNDVNDTSWRRKLSS